MILTSDYQISKMTKELETGEAKISRAFTRENKMYYVVERLDLWRSDMVPAWLVPDSWADFARGVK